MHTPAASTPATPPPGTVATEEVVASASAPAEAGYAQPAPAPMAPPSPASHISAESVAVASVPRGIAPPAAPPPPVAASPLLPVPESAGVGAGEWDDNANYREFQKWLGVSRGLPFHPIDVSHRRFVVVRDANGRAVPDCPVSFVEGDFRRAVLTTAASGRALFFPHAVGMRDGAEVRATADCAGSTATATFSLADDDGVVDLRLPTVRQLPARRPIDVAFVLDTTGSMAEEIAAVKATIRKVAGSLARSNLEVRAGLVAYKDRGDEYVTRVYPMTRDFGSFEGAIAGISASGGGDIPESVNEAVHVALTRLDWDKSAVGRYAFLVGDAPPHLDYPQDFDYANDARDAASRGIQVFTIAASGMDDLGQVVWRQIAQYTNARNMFVLRGGAGPQSTGAGDPKSSCGGTQTRFTSDNLDALILSDIRRETDALDADPLRIAGLNRDENAKPCGERLIAKD